MIILFLASACSKNVLFTQPCAKYDKVIPIIGIMIHIPNSYKNQSLFDSSALK